MENGGGFTGGSNGPEYGEKTEKILLKNDFKLFKLKRFVIQLTDFRVFAESEQDWSFFNKLVGESV